MRLQSFEFKEKTHHFSSQKACQQGKFHQLHTTKSQDVTARQSSLKRLEFSPLVHLSVLSGKC